jgi:dTDP-N-acetylfucosamine:lipid II N-acetylfucosaminyltransferase
VMMDHVRQQATGNVSIALLKGAKVFLRPENLLTPFYRDMGAVVHAFPDVPGADVFEPLSAQERETNRNVVLDYWSHRTVVEAARRLETFRRAA